MKNNIGSELKKENVSKRQKILLHTCCGDCAIKAIEFLQKEHPDLEPILYYNNSNIHPRTEYIARQKVVQEIAVQYGLEFIGADWSPATWFKAIENCETNVNLVRCKACWKLRLRNTIEKAISLGINRISTTLLTSHYQNDKIIREIGDELLETYNSKNLEKQNALELNLIDIRKSEICNCSEKNNSQNQDIKKPSTKTTAIGFYKQNYCGCVFSLKDRYIEKYS